MRRAFHFSRTGTISVRQEHIRMRKYSGEHGERRVVQVFLSLFSRTRFHSLDPRNKHAQLTTVTFRKVHINTRSFRIAHCRSAAVTSFANTTLNNVCYCAALGRNRKTSIMRAAMNLSIPGNKVDPIKFDPHARTIRRFVKMCNNLFPGFYG